MPQPASVKKDAGKFRLTSDFNIKIDGVSGTRAELGAIRFLWQMDDRTGLRLAKTVKRPTEKTQSPPDLMIFVPRKGELLPREDESYQLIVTPEKIDIKSETDLGAMYGMATLAQLLSVDDKGYYFPACTIEDKPRFPWRGLLIDVCRHWMPMEVIKRNIDGMAALKMNVLHLHLSEDQGFRVESKTYPKLHQLGSGGNYFTQQELVEIVDYADARGIRVIPEFDMPGHATSWFPGYPELASAPGPYQIEKKFGVFNPTLDPTKESTYTFLEGFLKEMITVFNDPYIHIGGDENNGKQWDANPEIQAFMKEKGFKDNEALQSYFNQRILKILQTYGVYMIGWDEILQPDLPKSIVIQSWRGRESLYEAAKKGYQGILSNGYYIDLCRPASHHYLNDPLPADAPLTDAEKLKVLGGEATMWAELVTPETVDSRIWPRTAAIAERFWSPREVNNVEDMYRRLDIVSRQLEEIGLTHVRNRESMMRRITKGQNTADFAQFVSYVEPLKVYKRHHQGVAYSTDMSFTRLPDVAIPDAPGALRFNMAVDKFVDGKASAEMKAELKKSMTSWGPLHESMKQLALNAPQIKEMLPLAANLEKLGKVGLEAMDAIRSGTKPTSKWKSESKATIKEAKTSYVESELMVISGIERLMEAANKK